MTEHSVPGLPSVYSIVERTTGYGTRFTPKLRGKSFTYAAGRHGVAWYNTLDEAVAMLHEFVSRMQS